MTQPARPAVILLVEDDPGDQVLTRRSLAAGEIDHELYIVQDGKEALDYLFHRGQYGDPANSPRPDLILLDINLPKIDGKQVLKEIKKEPGLRRIPVVILSTSQADKDVRETYDLGVSSYIAKPMDVKKFRNVVLKLQEYWLKIGLLPPRG